MNIAILDDYTDTARTCPAFAKLAGHDVAVWSDPAPDHDTLAARLRDVEVVVLIRERMQVGEALLARLPRLRMISHVGNHPNVDVDACTRHGILFYDGRGVVSTGQGASSTAELTWGLILAAIRRLPQNIASMRAGAWQHSVGRIVSGKTLGVYGYANTGKRVAAVGRAFGMDVQVWGRGGSQERAVADGLRAAESRNSFFATSDIVTLHMRLAPETQGLVTAADLALMKPDSILINTARAPLIETGALEAALRAGRPGAAGVDVYEHEPVGADHPLFAMDNVVCTPHLGYATREQLEGMFDTLVENVLAYARGETDMAVNRDALGG